VTSNREGDHLSRKRGNVAEFDSWQGNVRDFTKSQGSVGKVVTLNLGLGPTFVILGHFHVLQYFSLLFDFRFTPQTLSTECNRCNLLITLSCGPAFYCSDDILVTLKVWLVVNKKT